MIDKQKFRYTCSQFFQYMKKGRGGIFLGGNTLLGGNVIGQQILTDAHHAPSVKTFFTPDPVESSVLALLFHLIKGGMVCADIGAGCGYHTVFLAFLAGPNGKIYSFEGIPECFELLAKNTHMNELYTICCINRFLADKVKKITHTYFAINYQFFFSPPLNHSVKEIKTETSTLDHVLQQMEEPFLDFIKINGEADLPEVWKGMTETLSISPNIKILCTLSRDKFIQSRQEFAAFFEDLERQKFTAYLLPTLQPVDKTLLFRHPSSKTILLSRQEI